jgi:hypothetical protein
MGLGAVRARVALSLLHAPPDSADVERERLRLGAELCVSRHVGWMILVNLLSAVLLLLLISPLQVSLCLEAYWQR